MRAGLTVAFVLSLPALCHAQSPDDQYVPGPESQRQEGVPRPGLSPRGSRIR